MAKTFKSHRVAKASPKQPASPPAAGRAKPAQDSGAKPKEVGGPSGPEPTRYGDWEKNGICYDF